MSEKELILGCLKKNSKYQKALFDNYAGVLMTICRRYFPDDQLAEDALQEGFIRIFGKIEQFEFKGSFEGWMKRIMVNICLRKLQREKKLYEWNELEGLRSIAVSGRADASINEEDLLIMISQLPTGYRTVFNMFAIDGFSHREISESLGITESTSRSQLVKARNMLKRMLEEEYGA